MSNRKQLMRGFLATVLAISLAQFTQAQERGDRKAHPETAGTLKSVDTKAGTITIALSEARERGERGAPAKEKTFTLAKNVEVAVASSAGSGGGRAGSGVFKEAKLAELGTGIHVVLTLSADQKTVESILAEAPTIKGVLKAVDLTKKTLTVQTSGRATGRDGAVTEAEEKTFGFGTDVEVALDDGRSTRFSLKEAKLADLPQKSLVTVRLFADMKTVQAIAAEGPTHTGTVKAVDAAKKTMTITVRAGGRGDDAGEEYALPIADEAVILVDDGRGRRLSLKAGKLADIPVGAAVTARLSPDQVSIMHLRAEGPMVTGNFKAVDADKGTIIISIPKGRDDAEERTLSLAKDVHVRVDGNEAKLSDLKVTDPPRPIHLRMSLDQKTVQAVTAQQTVGAR